MTVEEVPDGTHRDRTRRGGGLGPPSDRFTYTTYRDLSEKPEVIDLIQGVIVNETNDKFARVEQVKKFRDDPQGARP